MRLTNFTDYALRTLIYLAVNPKPDNLTTISDIAESYNISKSHLTKVIHLLAKLEYIESIRGKNGGIKLNKKPEDINVGQLMRQTEPDFDVVMCMQPPEKEPHAAASSEVIPTTTLPSKDTVNSSATAKSPISCSISPVCNLKFALFEAVTAFLNVMDQYTLADLVENKHELQAILN